MGGSAAKGGRQGRVRGKLLRQVISLTVQQVRPLRIQPFVSPIFPRADKLDAETRREVAAIAHATRRPPSHGGQIGGGGHAFGLAGIFGRGATGAGGAICAAGVQRVAKRHTPTDFRGRRRVREVGACGKAAAPSGGFGLLTRPFRRGVHPCALRLPPSVAARSPHFPPLALILRTAGGSGSILAAIFSKIFQDSPCPALSHRIN